MISWFIAADDEQSLLRNQGPSSLLWVPSPSGGRRISHHLAYSFLRGIKDHQNRNMLEHFMLYVACTTVKFILIRTLGSFLGDKHGNKNTKKFPQNVSRLKTCSCTLTAFELFNQQCIAILLLDGIRNFLSQTLSNQANLAGKSYFII